MMEQQPEANTRDMSGVVSGGGGTVTLAQVQERMNQLRMAIQSDENLLAAAKLQAQRTGTMSDEEKMRNTLTMQNLIQKREYLSKMMQALQRQGNMPQLLPGGGNAGPGPGWNGQGGSGPLFEQNLQRDPTSSQPVLHPQGPFGPIQGGVVPGMGGQMTGSQFPPTIPTREQTQIALINLAKSRRDVREAINHLQPIDISPDQRAAYDSLLENAHRLTLDLDPKLPILYSLMKNEERFGRVVKIIAVVQHQRTSCFQGDPRIIIGIEALRSAYRELVRLNEAFSAAVKQAGIVPQNQGPQEHPRKQVEESVSQEQVDLLSGALSSLDLSLKSYDSP